MCPGPIHSTQLDFLTYGTVEFSTFFVNNFAAPIAYVQTTRNTGNEFSNKKIFISITVVNQILNQLKAVTEN